MEGHQITWNTNVPYEELIKQCPFLSQRASLPFENKGNENKEPEVQISKSKKKRLKKRLKAISLSNKHTTSEELQLSFEAHNSEMSSKAKSVSVTDRTDQVIEQPMRAKDEVDGEISFTRSKISGAVILPEKDSKKKIKQQRKEGNKDDNITVKQGKSVAPAKQQPLNANPSHQKAAIKNSEASNSLEKVSPSKKSEVTVDDVQGKHSPIIAHDKIGVSIEKSREEIIAEREAKKKAKQLAKQKKNNKDQGIPSVDYPLETETKSNLVPDNVQDKISSAVSESKLEITKGKSREDVLAEREAKKKAKHLARQSKFEKNQETTSKIQNILGTENNKTEIALTVYDIQSENKESSIKSSVAKNESKVEETKVEGEKSKAQLKAERRAKQEAQRAAKEAEKKLKLGAVENKENQVVKVLEKKAPVKEISKDSKTSSKGKIVSQQRIKLFSHLHLGQKPSQTILIPNLHPSIVELGIKYSSRIINGSNARCIALLKSLKEVIYDYSTPAEKEFSRGLESKLGELTNYLNQYRPFAVSMTNALRHIKSHLTQLPNNVSDDEAKRKLFDVIDTFIREQIDVAGEAICESVKNKITNGDVILIYSCSSLLYRILTESHRSGRLFSVIVVDGGPWFEGREMLRRLVEAGLKCSYVQVSALSFIVRQATKVLLGAHALLANGCVMSRAGSALVALEAHIYNVPVLVCCETYKFCERVQTDAFVYNELGSTDDLAKEDTRLSDWQSLTFLTPLSIVYDITPPDLVTAVVTEIAILPCTSVPVILRVKPSDVVS